MTTDCDPLLVALEMPGPETAQLVTPEAFQEIVVDSPDFRRAGAAEIEANGSITVTVAVTGAEVPVGPEQVI